MLDLVPLRDLGLEKRWPKLTKLQDELIGLEQHRQRAEEQASLLQNGLPSARERDLAEAAAAIRGGSDLPGNAHEEAIIAELERARRDAVVYQRAVAAAQTDIGVLRTQHQAELFNDVTQRRAEIAAEMAEGARTAAAAYTRYADLERLVTTLEPVAGVEETDQPARSVTHILFATGRQAPERGEIEGTLGYLVGLGEGEVEVAHEVTDGEASGDASGEAGAA